MVGVELDDPLARMLENHSTLEWLRDGVVVGREHEGARNRRKRGLVNAHGIGERRDRLWTPAGHGPSRLLARTLVVDRRRRRLLREHSDRRITLDHEVGLDHVVLALREARQVEQALAVGGHERAHEDQGCDSLGAVRGRLGHDGTTHAVPHEDGSLGSLSQNGADALGAACERDVFDGCLVVPSAWQVESLDRVARCFEWPDHGLPAPRTAEGAVYEDETCHRSPFELRRRPSRRTIASGITTVADDVHAIAVFTCRTGRRPRGAQGYGASECNATVPRCAWQAIASRLVSCGGVWC